MIRDPLFYYSSRTVLPETLDLDKNFDPSYKIEMLKQIIGINCFQEILSESDLRMHMGSRYIEVVKSRLTESCKHLMFYSKRLNIAIFEDGQNENNKKEVRRQFIVIDLRGKSKPVLFEGIMRTPTIRNFQDNGLEVLRFFMIQETKNSVSCHTFINSIDTQIEASYILDNPLLHTHYV